MFKNFNLKKITGVLIPVLVLFFVGIIALFVFLVIKLAVFITIIAVAYIIFVLPGQGQAKPVEPVVRKSKKFSIPGISSLDDVLKIR